MSTLIPKASGDPAALSAFSASSSAARPRAITATLAPSAARVVAIARPIPLLPPVTTAVAPAKPRSIALPSVRPTDADAAHAKAHDLLTHGVTIAIACRPLPFDARPDRAVDGQRVGAGI